MNRFGFVVSCVLALASCGPKHDYSHRGDDTATSEPSPAPPPASSSTTAPAESNAGGAPGGALATASGEQLSQEDATASLEIAKGIIKILGAMPKNYEDYRGDVLQTKDSDTVYGVKNTSFMGADSELIMIKGNGNAYYLAVYTGTKKLAMSLGAFTGGVVTVTNNDGNFASVPDSSASGSFFLTLKGTKVGKYSIDTAKQEGTLILGPF